MIELTDGVVKVLVSQISEGNMLIRHAMIGDLVLETALDSCATNCFISNKLSEKMKTRGYSPVSSSICYSVVQGKPLCDSNRVQFLPITLINEEGDRVQWDFCLFIIADCGADVIIGYPALEKGQIIRYNPPQGYEQQLLTAAQSQTIQSKADLQLKAAKAARNLHLHEHEAPLQIVQCMRSSIKTKTKEIAQPARRTNPTDAPAYSYTRIPMVIAESANGAQQRNENHGIASRATVVAKPDGSTRVTVNYARVNESMQGPGCWAAMNQEERKLWAAEHRNNVFEEWADNFIKIEIQKGGCKPAEKFSDTKEYDSTTPSAAVLATALNTDVSANTTKINKKKGETKALTAAEPYGINPPLDDEVLEALQTLKALSEILPENYYSAEQLKEIQKVLAQNRPEWGDCLTCRHLEHTFDEKVKLDIEQMMDVSYKETVFGKSLKEPAKVAQYEINQKPGHDEWTPQKARRFKNPLMYDVVDTHLDWQLADGLLSTSCAIRPAVVTVVEKEGRDPRTCCDYRLRNGRTEVPTYPMPDISEHIDDSIGYKYYCSFDMAKMFNQIEIKKEHRDLAAFITHRGVFAPHRVQFGLAGGPQHAVREVGGLMIADNLTNGVAYTKWALEQNAQGQNPPYELCKHTKIIKGSKLTPFIDDVFLKSNHPEGIIKQTELLFEFCKKYHLLLSRKKANICKTHLKMLGMVVSKEGKHLDPSRIVSLLETAIPRSKETLQSLLCSYNFVRQFIPDFSSIAAPLYEATRGIIWKGKGSGKSLNIHKEDPAFAFTAEMTRAYAQLRTALLSAPILVNPRWDLPLFLSVDASIRGEGWVLWQLLPTTAAGPKVAVAILYGSRKYNETESAWETTRQEANAIKDAINDIEDYIFGQQFYLFSDHLNLRWMHNSVNRAVIRMRNMLSQYNMQVVHCPGLWNNADSHSRLEAHTEVIATAANLNSATVATMREGAGLIFSTGTDTSEDNLLEGVVTNVTSTRSKEATLLMTQSHRTTECEVIGCAWCRDMPTLQDDSDSENIENDDEEEECAPFTNTRCFRTSLEAQILPRSPYLEKEWEEIISQALHAAASSVPPDVAIREANEWNFALHARLPTLQPCLTDTLPPRDEQDEEDLQWCERIVRTAYVHRIATRKRNEKETGERLLGTTPTCLTVGEQAERQQAAAGKGDHAGIGTPKRCDTQTSSSTHYTPISMKDKKIIVTGKALEIFSTMLEQDKDPNCMSETLADCVADDTTCIVSTQPEVPVENFTIQFPANPSGSRVVSMGNQPPAHSEEPKTLCEVNTQTSPADFRAAQVKTPDEYDFAAVHGDLQGHHGLDYTYRKLFATCGSKWANERGMATKVKAALKLWLQGCPACQKVKELKEKVKCKHSFIVSRPFLEVSYDIIVFTREDKNGNRYLIVAIDNFTKLVEIKATKHKDAETVAQFLLEIASRYGKIARLRSDRDPAFTSLIVTYLNKIRNVESVLCVAYHPQANSICERQNGIIMQQLMAMCVSCVLGAETKAAWSDLVPFIFSVVNNTPKNPLGISPLAMIYGIFANYERPLLPPAHTVGERSNPVDFVDDLIKFQTQLLEAAEKIQEDHLAKYAAKYYKQRNEKHDQPRAFQQGDFVLLKKLATGIASKLAPRYLGPRLVLERKNNDDTHPVLELMDLTDMTVSQAAAEDCKIFNTGWFEETTMVQELTKLAASDKEEFIVENICSHLPKGSKRNKPLNTYMFLVKWKDFSESENTWEPWSNLKDLEPYVQYSKANPLLNLVPKK